MKFKIKSQQLLIASLLAMVATLGACRTAPLRQPSFEVQASSQNQVETAVKSALKKRNWAILRQTPGTIKARYKRASHSATVGIDYSRSLVNIKLINSEDLDQGVDRSGDKVIHKAYDKWISNLENDIYVELSHLQG